MNVPSSPTLVYERRFWAEGLLRVAGVDEAGRGAWAGPVAVAAVVLPPEERDWPFRDSKTLSAPRREALAAEVRQAALAWAVELASAAEVDAQGVLAATKRAALRALSRLSPGAQALVTDYLTLDVELPLVAPPRADARSYSVAAASLLAKTARDAYLRELDSRFPHYGFARHKGYGVPLHRAALGAHGPCEEHRLSFAPVAACRGGTTAGSA